MTSIRARIRADRPASSAAPQPGIARLRPAGTIQALTWAAVLVLAVGPLVPLAYSSIRSKPFYAAGGVFTLSPYRQLFADPAFWAAVRNTTEFAVTATVAGVALGTALAVLTTRTNVAGARAWRWLILLPLALPPLGTILGWNALYGPGGYAQAFITSTLHIPFDLTTVPGMSVLGTAVAVPIAFLTCQASLSSTDSALEDAARSAGASPWQVLARVTVPLLRPAMLNAGLLVFTLSLEALGIPLLLGSASGHDFVASYLYNTWSGSATPDPPSVSAGAMLLLAMATILLAIRHRLLGTESRFVSVTGRRTAAAPLDLGRWRIPLGILIALYLAGTTFGPVLALALSSFVELLTPLIAPWHLLTLANWRTLSEPAISGSIRNSVEIALIGALVTTAFAALATIVAHRSAFRLRTSIRFALLYPRAIPGLIVGIGFFWAFLAVNPPGSQLRNSIWGIMVALSVRSLTLAYLVLYPSLARISDSLDKAAQASGATWWRTTRSVIAPILRPTLLIVFMLAFVSILNDYDPALFLVTPSNEVMGVTMIDTFHQGFAGPVAAMAMIQVALTVAVIAISTVLIRSMSRKGRA